MPRFPGHQALAISLRALGAHPLRTLLSTLGIVMGVASLVAVLSISDGVERFSRAQLASTTDLHGITVRPSTTRVVDGVVFPNPGYPIFTAADGKALAAALNHPARVTVVAAGPALVRRHPADVPRAAVVTGRSLPSSDSLAAGRHFTPEELERGDRLAVVSAGLVDGARGPAEFVGTTLLLHDTAFAVIGVLAPIAGERGLRVEVPLGAVRHATDPGSTNAGVPSIQVRADRLEDVQPVREAVERWVESRIPDHERVVQVASNQVRLRQASQAMLVFKLTMSAIVSISLLVGGIGIMNVLLASVVERTREIGIRRASGARRRDVLWQFLAESVLVTGLGSAIGVVVGFAGAEGVSAIIRARADAPVDAILAWPTVAAAAGAAVLVGLSFGIYPALRAARLSPIDAIRHE